MPPRKVQFVQGHYYHIYNRGAGRQALFRENRNYQYLLELFKECTADENVSVIAYCLMPNHYHWCLRQDGEQPVGNVPTRVWGSYTRAYNNAYLAPAPSSKDASRRSWSTRTATFAISVAISTPTR